MKPRTTQPVRLHDVQVNGGFWGYYQDLVRDKIIPYQWQALNDAVDGAAPSGCIRNYRLAARKNQGLPLDGTHAGRVFQDTDLTKWLEAVAGHLACARNPQLEAKADEMVDLIGQAQEPDGYLNTYGTLVLGNQRWRNLRDEHELYCSGHLIEAAVAIFEATGKRTLLEIAKRNVALIAKTFGPGPGQKRGYPGHPEIELALVRLYQATRNAAYLDLADFFVRERGRKPLYFEAEASQHGVQRNWMRTFSDPPLKYNQSHLPLIEQHSLEGHAVRALYLLSGVADVAAETGADDLLAAARRLWGNVTRHRMYVTGGVGSTHHGEAFTFDDHLPNETAYAETCASIALVFAARRLLAIEPQAEVADVLERALYNTCIAGVQLDGTRFLYANPLQVWPEASRGDFDHWHVAWQRQKWFGSACCPPNLARLLTSLGQYIYTVAEHTVYQHLYADCRASLPIEGGQAELVCQTDYPAGGAVRISKGGDACRLALRIPGWCRRWHLAVDGIQIRPEMQDGYARIACPAGEVLVALDFELIPERVTCHPSVPENIGKVCLQRGPLVYCLEQADNGPELWRLALPDGSAVQTAAAGWPGGVPNLLADGLRLQDPPDSRLYLSGSTEVWAPCELTFVPYYAWSNRTPGEMLVWLHQQPKTM